MNATLDDEYLTVKEIAEHLKLNQQTLRNWIDDGQLPAVRIGRRVRVRRADLDRVLARGATRPAQVETSPPAPPPAATTEALEQLAQAHRRADRLLGRRSVARRVELAEALQNLTDAVAAALSAFSGDSDRNTGGKAG